MDKWYKRLTTIFTDDNNQYYDDYKINLYDVFMKTRLIGLDDNDFE